MHPEGAALIGGIVIDFMKQQGLRCVGGLELGAVPIVSTICPMSFLRGYTIDTFFVRKKAKEHGAKELIDGYIASRSEILLIDDVTTTGGSVLKAIDVVRSEHNCTVTQVLSIVDREEGATENLADNGIKLTSLFKRSDFQIG
jgi:orotate phosphoribosyltransferase